MDKRIKITVLLAVILIALVALLAFVMLSGNQNDDESGVPVHMPPISSETGSSAKEPTVTEGENETEIDTSAAPQPYETAKSIQSEESKEKTDEKTAEKELPDLPVPGNPEDRETELDINH